MLFVGIAKTYFIAKTYLNAYVKIAVTDIEFSSLKP